jgi:DNA-binding response OmpR family regulator
MREHVTVLVVDDELALADVVAGYLEREGFAVVQAHDGPSAVEVARAQEPDLIVLDVMLPGFDGVEACRRIRQFSDAYVIMLTARDDEIDKIVGLAVGADDYLVKPFSPRELIARVRAMLRRPRAAVANTTVTVVGDLAVDAESRTVTVRGTGVELTRTEFDLLATMASRPRLVFSRRQLIDAVWGDDLFGDEHLVDVHIGHLRRKLGDDAVESRYVRTVRGVGYGLGSE